MDLLPHNDLTHDVGAAITASIMIVLFLIATLIYFARKSLASGGTLPESDPDQAQLTSDSPKHSHLQQQDSPHRPR